MASPPGSHALDDGMNALSLDEKYSHSLSVLRKAESLIVSRTQEVDDSAAPTGDSTMTALEKTLVFASNDVFKSKLSALFWHQAYSSSPSSSPTTLLPWQPFALYCKLPSKGNEEHLVLICSAFGGRFAVPCVIVDSTELLWASFRLFQFFNFCHCQGLKMLHFQPPDADTLDLWYNVIDGLIQKSTSFCSSSEEILAILVLRRTVGLLLNVFPFVDQCTCIRSDSLRRHIKHFHKWGQALKAEVDNPTTGHLWREAMEVTGYGPWLFDVSTAF
jgi:hypothetical protein